MCRGPRGRASLCVLTGLRSRLFRAKEQFAQALAPAPACHRVPIEEQLHHIFFRPRLAPRGIAKLAHLDHRARRALTGPPCRYQDPFFLLAHVQGLAPLHFAACRGGAAAVAALLAAGADKDARDVRGRLLRL